VAVIPLGRRSRAGSSHLPAASPSRIAGCLFGVAPRRDCPFHPPSFALARFAGRLVSVALILTSRWTGVTCYAALRSPDVPLAGEPASDRPAGFACPILLEFRRNPYRTLTPSPLPQAGEGRSNTACVRAMQVSGSRLAGEGDRVRFASVVKLGAWCRSRPAATAAFRRWRSRAAPRRPRRPRSPPSACRTRRSSPRPGRC